MRVTLKKARIIGVFFLCLIVITFAQISPTIFEEISGDKRRVRPEGVEGLAAARSRSGSDSRLGCHSIPSRRFALLHYAAARSRSGSGQSLSLLLRKIQLPLHKGALISRRFATTASGSSQRLEAKFTEKHRRGGFEMIVIVLRPEAIETYCEREKRQSLTASRSSLYTREGRL